jgi:pimeloyl-ACP methyl ester carboxylesterase
MVEFVELDWAARRVRIEYQWIAAARADAPLMVFLHEGLGSVSMWRNFPRLLCQAVGCRGLVYSRPGYGSSTPRGPGETWGVDFMHKQAYEVLPSLLLALGVDTHAHPPWLLGHSDGGSIALLHAARFVRQVAGIVVLAPHVMVEDLSIASIEQTRQDYLHSDLRQRLARHHDDPDSAFWGWNQAWLNPEFRQWDIQEQLRSITCPVLAVQGQDDAYGTMEQIRGISRNVSHAQWREWADCGHSPQRDQPRQLIDAVTFHIRHPQ